jgi:hypothetical protein
MKPGDTFVKCQLVYRFVGTVVDDEETFYLMEYSPNFPPIRVSKDSIRFYKPF